ncbi:hypothetical protein DL93DRAFT_2075341 [Clavulina sp. PMI_390]|nr:hypothetical protein DL93DRAFT_2075341 [Clavulina sp. PMI_390]
MWSLSVIELCFSLKNHLEHQGYARDLLDGIDLWTYRDMPSMGQSKRLTSRIWAKQQSKILPYVEAALESLRSDIKRTSYSCAAHAINEECISRLPSIDYLPIDMYSSFSCWPNKLQSLLDEWALGEAFDAFLQSRKAKSPPPDLPSTIRAVTSELITQCSQRVRDHFTNLVQLQTNLPPLLLPLEILNLAIVVFRTPGQNWMKRGVPYYALRHSGSFYNENGEISVEYLESQWSFDNTGSSIMRQMVILHGMDPSTCTHYELDGVAEYVLCEVCGDMAMHWEAANRHWGRFHQGEDAENSLWRCLDEAEKAIFHPIWTRMQIFGPQDCCALCSAKCPRGLEFMEHILSEHSDILGDNPNTAQYRQPLRRWLYESAIQWPLSAQDP